GKQVKLTGAVSDVDPTGRAVVFSGVVTNSTTTDVYGNFSFTSTPSALGGISAVVTDAWGLISAPASVNVTNQAPQITSFSVSKTAYSFILTGAVTDEAPAGLTVYFSSGIARIN